MEFLLIFTYNGGFKVLSLVSFAATTAIVLIVRIVLAVLCLVSAGFIIFVVMKQSGNTDGMEAMIGSSNKSDDPESYYGKNPGARTEAKLKKLTYIAAIVLAVCCIAMIVIGAII